MLKLLLFSCLTTWVVAETEGPPAHMVFAQRLMSTLPELPKMIAGGMEGRNDGIKNMISSVLGDGLISQLVVNPIGVAEEVLPDLGLNKTEVMSNLDAMSGGMASNFRSNSTNVSGSLFGKNGNLLGGLLTTTQKTTTKEVMLVDGVAVDFDDFIRKNDLEDKFTTSKPPTTTTVATAEAIADTVLAKLANKMGPTRAPFVSQHQDDLSNTLNLGMIDPRRMNEVNHLLRRAPQKFDTLDPFGGMGNPPGFYQEPSTVAPLDPAINEVVTNLRTRGPEGMSVEDVRRLKDILRTYEETLQTKEFIAKRNQLQVLQNELDEHRKQIDNQRKMEAELKRKEQELEAKKMKMESQLKQQLSSWNLTFEGQKMTGGVSAMDLPELNPAAYPTLVQQAPVTEPPALITKAPAEEVTDIEEVETVPPPTTREQPRLSSRLPPRPPKKTIQMPSRSVPRPVPTSSQIQKDDENDNKCECSPIRLDKAKGNWVIALASKSLLYKMYEQLSNVLHTDVTSSLQCSTIEIFGVRQSQVAQEAKINWIFQTTDSDEVHKLQGNGLSMNHRSLNVHMSDLQGKMYAAPLCVLRSGGVGNYDYMIVTNANGPCEEAALLVRDPENFFDRPNPDLKNYLKSKISSKELETLDMVSFSSHCDV